MAARARIAQCHFDRLRYDTVHATTIAKTNLVFRRMRIGIDASRIHGDTQHVSRVSAVKKHVAIRMPRRV